MERRKVQLSIPYSVKSDCALLCGEIFLSMVTENILIQIRGLFFFQLPMGYKKKTNLHNIIILLPKVQQGLTYFST